MLTRRRKQCKQANPNGKGQNPKPGKVEKTLGKKHKERLESETQQRQKTHDYKYTGCIT